MARRYVVAGGTGFTGTYVVRNLLSNGENKISVLSSHPRRSHEFAQGIEVNPYNFGQYDEMVKNFRDADCFINTYWVRLNFRNSSFREAVRNSQKLVDACKESGVKRIVHISVANPSHDYAYEYYRGKMEVEDYIRKSGISYAILRPTLLFGDEEILVNNITWLIRKYGFFFIFGDGKYKVTPVFVNDVAREVVRQSQLEENVTEDVVGPESYAFEEIVKLIARETGNKLRIYHLSTFFMSPVCGLLSLLRHDTVVTPEELRVVIDNKLYSGSEPLGMTKFSTWVKENSEKFGKEYHSEVERHFNS